MEKNVQYYLSLPYNYVVRPISDESGNYYYGYVLELDGCQSSGETFAETLESLREAVEGYAETKLAHGLDIPEPVPLDAKFSGKFNVRLPKTLHHRLTIEAEKEGISLNQYVLYKLAK